MVTAVLVAVDVGAAPSLVLRPPAPLPDDEEDVASFFGGAGGATLAEKRLFLAGGDSLFTERRWRIIFSLCSKGLSDFVVGRFSLGVDVGTVTGIEVSAAVGLAEGCRARVIRVILTLAGLLTAFSKRDLRFGGGDFGACAGAGASCLFEETSSLAGGSCCLAGTRSRLAGLAEE